MGHSEMGLAVAGLKQDQIQELTQKLAKGDWTVFPPAQRVALQFAHKFAKEPAAVTDKDIGAIVDVFGADRALDLIWYNAWCNYMTRVADAFQFPLEQENVFAI